MARNLALSNVAIHLLIQRILHRDFFSGEKNGNIVTNRDEKPEEEAKLVSESTSPATEKNEITFMQFIKTTLWPYMVR